jgi:hypothetical protein
MKSVRWLMVAIGVVALNLALGRFLYSYHSELPDQMMPGALLMQLGLVRVVRCRGRARVFWAGFIAFGVPAVHSRGWGLFFEGPVEWTRDPVAGCNVAEAHRYLGGEQTEALWGDYEQLALECLVRFHSFSGWEWPEAANYVIVPTVWLLPQLLIALTGGLLALGIMWGAGCWRRKPPTDLESAERLGEPVAVLATDDAAR